MEYFPTYAIRLEFSGVGCSAERKKKKKKSSGEMEIAFQKSKQSERGDKYKDERIS